MKITLKLYATLQGYLPAAAVNNSIEIEVEQQTTLHQIIDRFSVPRKDAHLVLINGTYFGFDERDEPGVLKEGDVLAVWPPVAGG